MRIRFRSRFSKHKILGNSLQKHKNLGTDWEGIQPYIPSHDARHIIWKKSTYTHNLVEKNFEENSQISLILIHIEHNTDFFDDNQHITREQWKKNAIQIIAENAKISNIPCKILHYSDIKDFFQDIKKYQFSHHMMMIFGEISPENYEKNFSKISLQNEIIWIWNYHFFEKNPHENLLIDGKIFDKKLQEQYTNELSEYENFLKKFFAKNQISFLATDTSSDISLILNNFFKYSYAQ